MFNGIIAHRSTALDKNEFCHLDDEHLSSCILSAMYSVFPVTVSITTQFWEWVGFTQIGDNQTGFESGVSSFFSLVVCLPFIPQNTHLTVGQFMPWLSHLHRMDQAPEPWRSAQDLLMLDDRQAEVLRKLFSFTFAMIEDIFTRPSFFSLCSACLPSTVQGLLLSASLAPATFPHFHTDSPFHLLTPKPQDSSWRLPAVTLPYHCTYRLPTNTSATFWPLCVQVHLKLSSNQSCTAQLKLRWGTPWEGGMTACISLAFMSQLTLGHVLPRGLTFLHTWNDSLGPSERPQSRSRIYAILYSSRPSSAAEDNLVFASLGITLLLMNDNI